MKKDENFGLSENEYKFICNIMKGRIFTLSVKMWRENVVSFMRVLNKMDGLETEYNVSFEDIVTKLNILSAIEFLELIKETLSLWSFWSDCEKSYEMMQAMTPSQKIAEILDAAKK